MTDQQQQSWLPPAGSAYGAPAPVPGASSPIPGTPAPAPPRPPYETRRDSALKRLLGPLFVVVALLAKFGKGAFIVLKGAKFLTTSASMLVSVAAYALIWGWKFAVGFVALLFIHELGHYIQLRREGVKPSGMVFIPFLGAAVFTRSLGGNALAEARVGLAGPILGSLAAAALIPVATMTDDDFWRALAFTGLFLNLFNLLPVLPLDGGRAMAAMAPWLWFVGLAAIALLAFVWPNPIIFLILLFAVFETYSRWKRRKSETGEQSYYKVAPRHRVAVGVVYIGLIALLVLGMDATFVDRSDRL
jgi:Zn-dependent protease